MAQLKVNDQERIVPDGESVIEACEDMGVPFACQNGACGTCRVTVVSGMENLNERTDNEKAMGVEGNDRLMCQCKIKQGLVQIQF